ncbi:MAG TPA: S8 family serine peptidase [Thermoanaerobaculia bacterium]|nr:S8 family serine peptidase [Thermoanaerobaculia bacterium]
MRLRASLVLALVLAFGLTLSAQVIDPALQAKLGGVLTGPPLRVVVTFHQMPGFLDRALLSTLSSRTQFLSKLPIALVEIPVPAIQSLLGRANIRSLYLDRELEYYNHDANIIVGAPAARQEFAVDGSGIGVAVIDSGVDGTHADLPYGTKVVQNVKIVGTVGLATNIVQAVENLPNSDTSSGHGTHCAGSIAGSGSASGGYHAGIAPGAHLVGVGTGDAIFVFYALEGFNDVLENRQRYNIRVVSNSWGTTGLFDANDPVNVASKAAHDAGLTVVFAAGNEGPADNTLNPYSVAPWVIGVAAGNKDGSTLADFSSRGIAGDPLYRPAITAPGVDIFSTRALNTLLPVLGLPSDVNLDPTWIPYYTTMSGTSMATPQVAGICALLLSAKPSMTPVQVRAALVSTATPMPGYGPHEAGAGYVNAHAAIDSVLP